MRRFSVLPVQLSHPGFYSHGEPPSLWQATSPLEVITRVRNDYRHICDDLIRIWTGEYKRPRNSCWSCCLWRRTICQWTRTRRAIDGALRDRWARTWRWPSTALFTSDRAGSIAKGKWWKNHRAANRNRQTHFWNRAKITKSRPAYYCQPNLSRNRSRTGAVMGNHP